MEDLSWHRPGASTATQSTAPVTPLDPAWNSEFHPCASTASLFLFSQGSVILCLHHDTLAVERRFTLHEERIAFICVDNVSERGAGRLVVSYDFAQTAIVWDLFTGSEISRFASYEPLRVASWMRNGNVAFGNGKGDVILFEPSTSEHLSARTIFDPITALAPSADCRTYAIGYQNGSILIATLHPTFTILHTLSTSRGPSPIACLAWHASSSKQKSDMLATQTLDGDLRVWSVAKAPLNESPRVIRALKRTEPYSTGPKWISWSKNGRIVQYSDRETWVWDVRTKHVTYVTIPTIEDVLGMASYGPTASLFTLGPDNTVQQYDLENPAMVKNVRHLPMDQIAIVEETKIRPMSPGYFSRGSGTRSAQGFRGPEVSMNEIASQQRAATASPMSAQSRTNSISSHASSGRVRPFSPVNKSTYSGTTFSMTSPIGRLPSQTGTSIAYGSSASVSSVRSRGGSRLRNEVTQSPVDKPLADLFPYTRERVNEVSYIQQLPPLDESRLTPDALRRQMLRVVFGWEGDIEDLIRDELNRHPPASQNSIFLSRWLGEDDPMQMVAMLSAGPVNSSAWMFLALSQMGGQEQANKVGQSFVQRLLEIGDVHASATILLALGDRNDAIEVYVSRNYYMEAILMTCLLCPLEWQRQSYLVRRWGEHVVSNAQQQLAIRCFMCTGAEPSEPWMSPTAPNVPYRELHVTSPVSEPQKSADQLLKPETNNRMTVKNSALKLITSFGPQAHQTFKFPGLKSDDRTPTNAPGITPIAESAVGESALSPGGLGSYRLNNVRSINTAMSSRVGTPNHAHRQRLPSIGETPVDVQPPNFPPRSLPTPVDSSSDKEKQIVSSIDVHRNNGNNSELPMLLLTSARYEPGKDSHGPSPQTAVQTGMEKFENIKGLPSPAAGVFETLKEQNSARNGSRDRKPEGLHIQWPPVDTSESEAGPYTDDTGGGTPSSVFQSLRSTKSPSVSGRSIDQYISSLDEANHYSKHLHRPHTKSRRHAEPSGSEHPKKSSRNGSVDSRGRTSNRYIAPAKRSPSSPVPMSPEEFAKYNASVESLSNTVSKHRSRSHTKGSSRVRTSSTADRRHRSTSRGVDRKHKAKSRNSSRRESRGRSNSRTKSGIRSPTSPLPMSPAEDKRGFEDTMRFVTSDRERLHRSRPRSSSRRRDRGASSVRREQSPDIRQPRATSGSRQPRETQQELEVALQSIPTNEQLSESFKAEFSSASSILLTAHERAKREMAAAELEARRLSLARRPSAPKIPMPGDFQTAKMISAGGGNPPESPPSSGGSFGRRVRSKSNASKRSPDFPPNGSDSGSSTRGRSGTVGLPATPKAMRRPKYSDGYIDDEAPAVPDVPFTLPSTVYQAEAARISRSMSVPVVDFHQTPVPADLPHHPRFIPNMPRSRSTSRTRGVLGHRRENSRELGMPSYGSPPAVSVSIEPDITIENTKFSPPILPELQHLTTPPPPPPPPAPAVGQRSKEAMPHQMVTENARAGHELARPMTTGADAPSMRRMSVDHRRGRSINESFASKFRNLTGRMRSTSRGPGVHSPPTESLDKNTISPYESVQMPRD